MKIISTMAVRPLAWLTFLGILALLLPIFTLSYWSAFNNKSNHKIDKEQHQNYIKLMHDVHHTMKFFQTNESSIRLARLVNATLGHDRPSFPVLRKKVSPILFQAFSTLPHLQQISFIGNNGLSFSLSVDGDKITALYTNGTTISGNVSSPVYNWYTQPVSDTGKLSEEATTTTSPPEGLNSAELLSSINSTIYASVGSHWSGGSRSLFYNTVPVDRSIGVVSLGFRIKVFSDFFASRDLLSAGSYVATKDGKFVAANGVLSDTSGDDNQTFPFPGLSCNNSDHMSPDPDHPSLMEISGSNYELYCSTISLSGVPSVYVLAFPENGVLQGIHKHNKSTLILLAMTLIIVAAFVGSFMFLAVISTRENMRLNSELTEQKETTRQAETRSAKKSMAVAKASHDVRASLSGIIGLIDICNQEVNRSYEVESSSELKQSLKQMGSCANDLLALLNSILDMSKLEAGKMQLLETEFSMTQLLEDLADLYHPVGMKKGVEVMLDPCDGSLYGFSNVKGDSGKLKQIISNLLSNSVKFTKEGHISIRAWARKFSFENVVTEDSPGETNFFWSSLCFSREKVKKEDSDPQDSTKTTKMDPNCVEYVFEVDDTGIGIPKEKQKAVFENYEQVKDAAAEAGGTGLGLGIVRSLVQLMGGDIKIMDKSPNKGTCFRFNIFLIACNDQTKTFPSYPKICNDKMGSSGQANSPSSPNKTDTSLAVLLIQNKGRRKMIHDFLDTLGLRVMVAKEAKALPSILKEVKSKLNGGSVHSSVDLSPLSCFSNSTSASREDNRNVLTAVDEGNETPSGLEWRPSLMGSSYVLLIIDANAGDFDDLSKRISDFRNDVSKKSKYCKVIWLEKPETRNLHFQQNNVAPGDDVFVKPLHGSRLFQVIENFSKLSEQQTMPSPKANRRNTTEVGSALDPDTSDQKLEPIISSVNATYQGEIEEIASPGSEPSLVRPRRSTAPLTVDNQPIVSSSENKQIETAVVEPKNNLASSASTGPPKPLFGKKILIAEDNEVQKRISARKVSMMGASSVDTCKNGKEALELVCKSLSDQSLGGSSEPPFHCILMDCQMPEMDGFEATRRIRVEEAKYGVHIPIFALTAHESSEICDRMIEAGMDAHLNRPLKEDQLVKALRSLAKVE